MKWTLTDRHARAIVTLKVANGSNVVRVMQTLRLRPGSCRGDEESRAANYIAEFEGTSLDFDLHAWIVEVDNSLHVESDLHEEIDRRFRQAGIEVPS
jgi:potassium efflux system protein